MTDEKAAPSINILPSDTHGDILVQLIKGQERAATQIEMQNRRLFGGDGMPGMLPAIIEQHKALATKLDDNKDELAKKIEAAKEDLSVKMVAQKTETDHDIQSLTDKHNRLDKKVTWYSGAIALLGTGITIALGYFGIVHQAKP